MIKITVSQDKFVYDIHSLVKAFYPAETVLVKTPEGFAHDEEKRAALRHKPPEQKILFIGEITYIYNAEDKSPELCGLNDLIRFSFFFEPDVPGNTSAESVASMEIAVNFSDKKKSKNLLKQTLYKILSARTGKSLPWGSLSGIRPVKIPMKLLEEGRTRDEIRDFMKSEYFASDEKINLAIAVAENERAALSSLDFENGWSLYADIPFCPSTCLYCSFTSYPISAWRSRIGEYLGALEKEMAAVSAMMAHTGRTLTTIYVGGGTPTSLSAEQLDRFLSLLEKYFDTNCAEFTVEAGRPDSITTEKLAALKAHGVGRISVNPQTMKDETLRLIGRHHTSAQTIEAYKLARDAGFENINMDLILGLPGETYADVERTMKIVAGLSPDDVTLHSLAIKRGSRLHKELFEESHAYQFENSDEIMRMTARYCFDMGLSPYYLYRQKNIAGNFENVGWSKPGKAGLYNILIMEEKQPIVAIGPGGSTKIPGPGGKITRVENVRDIEGYIARIDEMIERKNGLM